MAAEGSDDLAGIEYHGTAGVTADCIDAIQRLLLWGCPLKSATLLTVSGNPVSEHAFLLADEYGGLVAVKSGFTSGYGGEGPKGLSRILGLLDWHRIALEEIEVEPPFLKRLDLSALTDRDLKWFLEARPKRPSNLWDHINDDDFFERSESNPWRRSPSILPLSLIDGRLATIARDFHNDPDAAISKAYRKLETIVRKRISKGDENVDVTGSKLFAKAFHSEEAKLIWPGLAKGECQGRANLFTGAFLAHRNARAHRESVENIDACISEFLLLNHLYQLERQAKPSGDNVSEADQA